MLKKVQRRIEAESGVQARSTRWMENLKMKGKPKRKISGRRNLTKETIKRWKIKRRKGKEEGRTKKGRTKRKEQRRKKAKDPKKEKTQEMRKGGRAIR